MPQQIFVMVDVCLYFVNFILKFYLVCFVYFTCTKKYYNSKNNEAETDEITKAKIFFN